MATVPPGTQCASLDDLALDVVMHLYPSVTAGTYTATEFVIAMHDLCLMTQLGLVDALFDHLVTVARRVRDEGGLDWWRHDAEDGDGEDDVLPLSDAFIASLHPYATRAAVGTSALSTHDASSVASTRRSGRAPPLARMPFSKVLQLALGKLQHARLLARARAGLPGGVDAAGRGLAPPRGGAGTPMPSAALARFARQAEPSPNSEDGSDAGTPSMPPLSTNGAAAAAPTPAPATDMRVTRADFEALLVHGCLNGGDGEPLSLAELRDTAVVVKRTPDGDVVLPEAAAPAVRHGTAATATAIRAAVTTAALPSPGDGNAEIRAFTSALMSRLQRLQCTMQRSALGSRFWQSRTADICVQYQELIAARRRAQGAAGRPRSQRSQRSQRSGGGVATPRTPVRRSSSRQLTARSPSARLSARTLGSPHTRPRPQHSPSDFRTPLRPHVQTELRRLASVYTAQTASMRMVRPVDPLATSVAGRVVAQDLGWLLKHDRRFRHRVRSYDDEAREMLLAALGRRESVHHALQTAHSHAPDSRCSDDGSFYSGSGSSGDWSDSYSGSGSDSFSGSAHSWHDDGAALADGAQSPAADGENLGWSVSTPQLVGTASQGTMRAGDPHSVSPEADAPTPVPAVLSPMVLQPRRSAAHRGKVSMGAKVTDEAASEVTGEVTAEEVTGAVTAEVTAEQHADAAAPKSLAEDPAPSVATAKQHQQQPQATKPKRHRRRRHGRSGAHTARSSTGLASSRRYSVAQPKRRRRGVDGAAYHSAGSVDSASPLTLDVANVHSQRNEQPDSGAAPTAVESEAGACQGDGAHPDGEHPDGGCGSPPSAAVPTQPESECDFPSDAGPDGTAVEAQPQRANSDGEHMDVSSSPSTAVANAPSLVATAIELSPLSPAVPSPPQERTSADPNSVGAAAEATSVGDRAASPASRQESEAGAEESMSTNVHPDQQLGQGQVEQALSPVPTTSHSQARDNDDKTSSRNGTPTAQSTHGEVHATGDVGDRSPSQRSAAPKQEQQPLREEAPRAAPLERSTVHSRAVAASPAPVSPSTVSHPRLPAWSAQRGNLLKLALTQRACQSPVRRGHDSPATPASPAAAPTPPLRFCSELDLMDSPASSCQSPAGDQFRRTAKERLAQVQRRPLFSPSGSLVAKRQGDVNSPSCPPFKLKHVHRTTSMPAVVLAVKGTNAARNVARKLKERRRRTSAAGAVPDWMSAAGSIVSDAENQPATINSPLVVSRNTRQASSSSVLQSPMSKLSAAARLDRLAGRGRRGNSRRTRGRRSPRASQRIRPRQGTTQATMNRTPDPRQSSRRRPLRARSERDVGPAMRSPVPRSLVFGGAASPTPSMESPLSSRTSSSGWSNDM